MSSLLVFRASETQSEPARRIQCQTTQGEMYPNTKQMLQRRTAVRDVNVGTCATIRRKTVYWDMMSIIIYESLKPASTAAITQKSNLKVQTRTTHGFNILVKPMSIVVTLQ